MIGWEQVEQRIRSAEDREARWVSAALRLKPPRGVDGAMG